jgi:hypothetical protein
MPTASHADSQRLTQKGVREHFLEAPSRRGAFQTEMFSDPFFLSLIPSVPFFGIKQAIRRIRT